MPRRYFRNRWNYIDFVVVMGAIVAWIMDLLDIGGGGVALIKLLRLVRRGGLQACEGGQGSV